MIATKGTLNIAAIASGLKVNPSNASRTCDRLVRAGLLDRQESPADRRNSTLTLTARGHKIVQAITDRRREVIEQTLRKIPPAHRDEVVAAFDHFTRAVGESAEHLEPPVWWPGNRWETTHTARKPTLHFGVVDARSGWESKATASGDDL